MGSAGAAAGQFSTAQAAALLQAWGRTARQLALVARMDCEVFRVRPADGGPDLALRIYNAERSDTGPVQAELAWLSALAEAGLHVPRPVKAVDGNGLVHARDSAGRPRLAVLLHWLPGCMRYTGLRVLHLRRCGELLADMHRVSAQLAASGRLPQRHAADGADLPAWAEGRWSRAKALPAALRRDACIVAQRLLRAQPGPQEADRQGFIHGDLHLWNLLFHQGRAGAIDFSDCGRGRWLQDLAGVLVYLKHPLPLNPPPGPPYGGMRDALLDGYASRRALPPDTLAGLDDAIVERRLRTLQWMAQDWPRPDLRPWGPLLMHECTREFRQWLQA